MILQLLSLWTEEVFKISSDNFCALPFGHTLLTTVGDFSVCCLHHTPEKYKINILDGYDAWNQSEYLNQVRQSFKDGEFHPGCSTCWQKEKLGEPSQRTRTKKEYQILQVTKETAAPINVEVQLGNLCNLRCLMCDEKFSSSILAENIQLGINQHTQQEFKWNDSAFKNLEDLISQGPKVLNIRGGEPMYNKQLLDIIENLPSDSCNKTLLHITTNGTQWSSRWKEAFKKFKLIRLMFSIDAVGDLYEYMRYPAKWSTVESNIVAMSEVGNVNPLIHCVLQNLNILSIGEIISWTKSRNLYLQIEPIDQPNWLSITNLPNDLKIKAIEHLNLVLTWELSDHLRQVLTACLTQLKTSSLNTKQWKQFQTQISMRDSLRNNSHKRFLDY